eukprot:6588104-Pyramimonas_sp.AAC.1
MQSRFSERQWPRSFWGHPVVKDAPPGVFTLPLGLFVDAARYGGQASSGKQRSVWLVSAAAGGIARTPGSSLMRNGVRYP